MPTSVRKLPAPAPVTVTLPVAPPESEPGAGSEGPAQPAAPPRPPERPPVVAPLTLERYRVQFTVGREAHDKLRRLQDLLAREIPDGDPAAIFDRAITLLLRDVEKKKLGATAKPRPPRPTKPQSRHIPAHIRRAVDRRDGGRCAFVARNGRRCTEKKRLDYHHVKAFALGGEMTVANVALRCAMHNRYEAELIFGPFDPSLVRESAAVYGAIGNSEQVPEPVRLTSHVP